MMLSRKAALFTVVAAEAMSEIRTETSEQTARDLWMLARELYREKPNTAAKGGDYSWAVLRAITLNALSSLSTSNMSHRAAEELLSLLGEISPAIPAAYDGRTPVNLLSTTVQKKAADVKSDSPPAKESRLSDSKGGRPPTAESDSDAATAAGAFARQLRESFTTLTVQASIVTYESKWAEDEATRPIDVPLSQLSGPFASVQAMGCVWRNTSLQKCSEAQSKCINRLLKIRRSLPTVSLGNEIATTAFGCDTRLLPLFVSSAMTIKEEVELELESVAREKKVDADSQGAMATFFNPFANKRSSKDKMTIVAHEEERAMLVSFGNKLAVPLAVQRCQIEFQEEARGLVKATPLSFTLPPKASDFVVQFPFSVLPGRATLNDSPQVSAFEVKGIRMTILGRVFFLKFDALSSTAQSSTGTGALPPPAALYPKKTVKTAENDNPRFKSCPSQPRLEVHFAKSGGPVDVERPIVLYLVDGELLTLPSLRLKNYPGPSGRGYVERIQIYSVDVPGLPDRKSFDTDEPASNETEDSFVASVTKGEKSPAMRLRALGSGFKLDELNARAGDGSVINFQIAASQLMSRKLGKSAKMKIRFRYRGTSDAHAEYWRRKEIALRIVCVNGPRISSIDFRPDLATGSAFAEMCNSLHIRNAENEQSPAKQLEGGNTSSELVSDNLKVGMCSGLFIATSEVVFILTVSNETTSEMTLSRDGGPVGGFTSCPLETLRMRGGVSAKFPVVLPRIPRGSSDGRVDVANEIVALTKLRWELNLEKSIGVEMAKGTMRIPLEALKDIMERYPTVLSRICESPCRIDLFVAGVPSHVGGTTTLSTGKPLEIAAEVFNNTWVPAEVIAKCSLSIEFFCARKDQSSSSAAGGARDYVWAGKLRHVFGMSDDGKKHRVKIVFVTPGAYCVSACARIRHVDAPEGVEEVWWAPVAGSIQVKQLVD